MARSSDLGGRSSIFLRNRQAVRDLQGKRVHVIDVEASSRDYEKTVKEYRVLLKK